MGRSDERRSVALPPDAGKRTDLSIDRPTKKGIRSKITTASDRKSVATGIFGPLPH